MIKFCFVVPPFMYHSKTLRLFNDEMPSIGLAYISAALIKESYAVTVVDGVGEGLGEYKNYPQLNFLIHGLSLDEIVNRIPENIDIIGITCMFSNEWPIYKTLIKKIKNRYPAKMLLLGGEHVTADWHYILNCNLGVSLCVIGEGEETILEFAAKLSSGESWEEIDGIALLKNQIPSLNSRRKRIKNFSTLYPAWHLFPIDKYLKFKSGMNVVNRSSLPILASRGCPYSCAFCSSPKMWGFTYNNRNPKELVDEMQYWKSVYPDLEHFVFTDLTMLLKKEWTIAFAKELIDRNLNVTWFIGPGTRTEIMDPQVLDILKKSQLVKVGFASESGSESTLKAINKKINLENMITSMKYSNKIGLPARTTIIYGFPGQTLKECMQNLSFAFKLARIGIDEVSVFFFAPYPGSQFHDELIDKNIIPNKLTHPEEYELFLTETAFSNLKLRSWSEHISSRQLIILFYLTHLIFQSCLYLFHPSKIYVAAKRIYQKKPVTTIEALVYSFFNRSILIKKIKNINIEGSL